MTPRGSILAGSAAIVAAIALAAAARLARGPMNPECGGFCLPIVVLALQWVALPVAILGAVLVAMGLTRREPADEPPPREE